MTTMHPLIAQFHDRPALVSPESHSLFSSLLNAVAGFEHLEQLSEAASNEDGFWPDAGSWLTRYRPYVVRDGILQIPIKGVLLHEFPYQLADWATGYEYILRAFQRGCEDYAQGNIKGIALVINSPGGMVAGCFDAADKALALKAETGVPVRAYAAESAYSAAYVWACVGDTITVTRTGGVGSIGVVMAHMDMSKLMDNMGVKVTFIHAGQHKVDGNPYEELPDDVKARFQARIDELYSVFVAHVAANRDALDEKAVRATEALCFSASEAISNGTADAIGSLDDALAGFAADLSNPPDGEEKMSNKPDESAAPNAAENTPVDTEALRAEGRGEGASAERERIKSITTCDEAQGRSDLASHLAYETDMSVDQAKGILAKSAKEGAENPDGATPFGKQMDAEDQPNVGASQQKSDDEEDEDSADGTLAIVRSLGLKGFAKRDA